ncbi:head GIN domain-containing protein [Chryseolinea sp. H1M3-3]|uniref:head GIN domain-containing protein n=1 Tax=Chryseolinea sp. H1M3-3 TaxID=3034144 RepID=UPI0023EA801E|nr:head GIN domain-containing protein [Chryseolinea sp. H1M3-3]
MKFTQTTLPLIAFLLLSMQFATAQEISKDLKSFNKVIVSPKINLILEQGDQENIRLTYSNVDPSKINIKVQGNTLRVYLDEAKVTEKTYRNGNNQKIGIYSDAAVTAYVTYKELEHLEIRGNQELTCNGPLKAERFTLKAYGENDINLASLKTEYLRTSLYGDNDLKIKTGKAEYQKYRLFGENKIDTQDVKSFSATATIFGESKLRLNSQDNLKVTAFGEPQVSYYGNASVNRGWIFGKAQITKLN